MYHLLLKTERLSVVEITTVTVTTIRKKVTNPESGTCTTSREGSKITIFKFLW